MTLIDRLLALLPAQEVPLRDVRMGPFWTVVWSEHGAGLAATQRDEETPHGHPLVRQAGRLLELSAQELAGWLRSDSLVERSLGMAALNSLLPVEGLPLTETNAEQVITERGTGRRVAVVGHFPFVPRLQSKAEHLDVLELRPRPGDLPASAASETIPQADVLAITGTAILNDTFEKLMQFRRPDAFVVVLGPTTPLSAVLFDYGVDVIAGTIVTDPQIALLHASQGAIFRQMRGVRLVTMLKTDLRLEVQTRLPAFLPPPDQ